jgi:phosphate transport system ATP-binding protein
MSSLVRVIFARFPICLARTLALDPKVILMDEPTSALDPKSTTAIEELMLRLKDHRTMVLVTHNMAQAERVCDQRLEMALTNT